MNQPNFITYVLALMLINLISSAVYSQENCPEWEEEHSRILPPVKMRINKKANFIRVKKVIEFTNTCPDTLESKIKDRSTVNTSKKNYGEKFVTEMTPPEGKGKFVFKDSIVYEPDIFEYRNEFTLINTSIGEAKTFHIYYFFIGDNVDTVRDENGKILRFEKIIDFRKKSLEVDSNLVPKTFGWRIVDTDEKIDTWKIWDLPAVRDERYSKLMKVEILNNPQDHSTTKVLIKEDNRWKKAYFNRSGNKYEINVKSETDSIKIINGEYTTACWVDYVNTSYSIRLYQIGSNEDYIHAGIGRMPIDWGNEYVITWNEDFLKFPKRKLEGKLEFLFRQLKEDFPKIDFYSFSHSDKYLPTFKLNQFSESEREELLTELLNKNQIKTISRILKVPDYERNFLTGNIQVAARNPSKVGILKAKANELGFELKHLNRRLYLNTFSYDGKLIDQEFVHKLIKLMEYGLVDECYPEVYSEVEEE